MVGTMVGKGRELAGIMARRRVGICVWHCPEHRRPEMRSRVGNEDSLC